VSFCWMSRAIVGIGSSDRHFDARIESPPLQSLPFRWHPRGSIRNAPSGPLLVHFLQPMHNTDRPRYAQKADDLRRHQYMQSATGSRAHTRRSAHPYNTRDYRKSLGRFLRGSQFLRTLGSIFTTAVDMEKYDTATDLRCHAAGPEMTRTVRWGRVSSTRNRGGAEKSSRNIAGGACLRFSAAPRCSLCGNRWRLRYTGCENDNAQAAARLSILDTDNWTRAASR